MANRNRPGDVHAPVEDTEVPLGLKALVILLFMLLIGLGVVLVVALGGGALGLV